MKAIYTIRNTINNKIYVGSAVNYNSRKSVHKSRLKSNKHHSPKLQNAWNKYGENSFVFEILEEVNDVNNLISREQYYIDLLKPFYNCSPTAGNCLGKIVSQESKEKMSKSHIGKKLSRESIEKRTNTRRENGWSKSSISEESKKKISKTLKDKYRKGDIIHAHTGKKLSQERKSLMRDVNSIPIIQLTLDGTPIEEFSSSKEAHLKTGLSNATIINILKGRIRNPKKFNFKYK